MSGAVCRRKRAARGAAAGLVALCVVVAGCGRTSRSPTGSKALTGPALPVLAFYDPSVEKPTGTVQSLLVANRAAVSDLSPLWYQVLPDGGLRSLATGHLQTWARQERIKLMPLVVNRDGTSAFLLNAAARSRAVAALATLVQRQNYAGLNIDFEELKNAARQPLVRFMQQLHARLHAMHRSLTIDIIPSGSERAAASGAYAYAALARNADEVVLMTYDDHDNTSSPGPIAPLAWVKRRLNVALAAGVPRTRLVLGIADYGYDWTSGGHGVEIGLNQVQALIKSEHITPTRSDGGEPHFTYTRDGVRHTVWYEDGRAILPKIQLARADRLSGLALWMVGFETAQYWQALRAAAGTATSPAGMTPVEPTMAPVRRAALRGQATAAAAARPARAG